MNLKEYWTVPLNTGGFGLPFTLKQLTFRFIVPVLALLIGILVLRFILKRILKWAIKDEGRLRTIWRWIRRLLWVILIVALLLLASSLLGVKAWAAFKHFFHILNRPFFSSGKTRISFLSLLLVIPVVILANWLGRLVSGRVGAGALKKFGLNAERAFSIGRLIHYAVISLVMIIGLSVVGIDLSVIGVIFGVLGIGIGFGIQFLVADFFAGITLISMGLIKEGDRIRVANTYDGIIRHIRLINTELVTFENETLIIPNSQLTGGAIHNFSYKDPRVVIINEVDVSYESDLDEVIEVMKSVAERNPWLDHSQEIDVRVRAFADSGITMQLRTMIRNAANGSRAFSWTNLEIWRAFRDSGVEIPFPQRVLHLAPPAAEEDAAEE